LSLRGSECRNVTMDADERIHLRCQTAALAPRASTRIELKTQAITLGSLRLRATASTYTREVTSRNNGAAVATPVRTPDSVHVAARVDRERFPIELVIDGISGPRGQHPEGTYMLDWQGRGSGRVTCLGVSGNTAVVGVLIEDPATPLAPGATPTRGLWFVLTDNGSPGTGRDTLTFGGGPLPSYTCPAPAVTGTELAITSGEITIVDTP
jgi:hypothetical protein